MHVDKYSCGGNYWQTLLVLTDINHCLQYSVCMPACDDKSCKTVYLAEEEQQQAPEVHIAHAQQGSTGQQDVGIQNQLARLHHIHHHLSKQMHHQNKQARRSLICLGLLLQLKQLNRMTTTCCSTYHIDSG